MPSVILLTDYKHRFGSKHNDIPYRSGMDIPLLRKLFMHYGFDFITIPFSELDFSDKRLRESAVLYTSSEDSGSHYKSYIEDIILGLELAGCRVIPPFKYLRAHHNKVFMEILRDLQSSEPFRSISSRKFGTMEEYKSKPGPDRITVIKSAEGANSKMVRLGKDHQSTSRQVRKLSNTFRLKQWLHEIIRSILHKGYLKESMFRKKYILQEFIQNLKNDWKIYIFWDWYFIFYRPILKKNNFRASGGGYENYLYGSQAPKPEGIFDFAESIHKSLNVPHLSLDIAWDGKRFYLIEFQALYFGTAGILNSDCYYMRQNGNWIENHLKKDIESAFVHGIIGYLHDREK